MSKTTLENVLTMNRAQIDELDLREMNQHATNAVRVAEQAGETRHNILTACNGRPPTKAQERDMIEAKEREARHAALAERLTDAMEEKAADERQTAAEARQDAAQQIEAGTVTWGENDGGELRGGSYGLQGQHTGRGLTYRPDDHRVSWTRDLRNTCDRNDPDARARLERNTREWNTETRALTSVTSGAASDLVPPSWALNLIATVSRPARVTADQVTKAPLPDTSMVINVPRIVTGASVAAQGTENTTVSDTNIATDTIFSNVHTLAGKQVLSFQLIDQSSYSMDQLVITDLAAELARQVDLFTLTSNATGKVGILSTSGVNAVTYTDASPTVGELYSKIADGVQRIGTARFLPATKIVMHPRRWAWFLAALDSTGRPLVTPESNHPMNAAATQPGVVAQGFAGTLQGLPVFLDSLIPTNAGAGTNEDKIIIMRAEDLLLWESGPRIIPDRISLAGQLSMQITLFEYLAVQTGRYPASISLISGTGLVAPTF